MFDYKLFITFVLPILGIFFPIYINLKKEIEDFELESNKTIKDHLKLMHREKLLTYTTICTVIGILIALFLSFVPIIKNLNFEDSIFFKVLPFKENFFENSNFTFSFITGTILSLFFIAFVELMIYYIYCPIEIFEYILYILIFIVVLILLAYLFIWFNYFISSFLSIRITQYYKFSSLSINIFIYIVLMYLALMILAIFDK